MKVIESSPAEPNRTIFAVDVGKDELHLYSEIGGRAIEKTFLNKTTSIEAVLDELVSQNQTTTRNRLLVVEPTGTYHEALLRIARQKGFETAWASGEKVAKMRVLEFGDIGKTDKRDPRAIYRVAEHGYLMKRRVFEERYQLLREWHHIYSAAEEDQKAIKITLHHELNKLFPDYDFRCEFLYSASGRALVHGFGANPHLILDASPKSLRTRMRKLAPRIQFRSIDRLRATAEASLRGGPSKAHAEVIETRLRQLYQDFETVKGRKQEARLIMERLYDELRQHDDRRLPEPVHGVITKFHLARLVAETGPLSDFKSWRQLYRFAGLNLREKRSGYFRGRTRIAKKGRWLLRKVLSHVALSLVKKTRLFGPYYHRKREVEKMVGAKAMTAVGRKVLKMVFGWYQSGEDFDFDRVFTCNSQYKAAA